MIRPQTSRAANFFLSASSVLVALAVAEVAVRVLRPQFVVEAPAGQAWFWHHEAGFYRHDPELGWAGIPGARGTFSRREFSHPVQANSAGWRDRERAIAKPPGVFRILALGDSFTWGHGVRDDETFSRRLESLLPGTEVLNMGLSGSSTDQQLLILKRHALAYRPDLVLVLISRNDFTGIMSRTDGPYSKPVFELGQDGGLRLTNVPVPEVTRLARLHHRLRRSSALWNLTESTWEQREAATDGPRGHLQASYEMMAALLGTMRAEAARAGARLAVGIVPSNAHTYLEPIPPLEVDRIRAIERAGAREGIPVLDLVPAFRAAARESAPGTRVDLHYPIDKHWNRLGHEVAALELARLLKERELLTASPPR